MVNRLRRQFSAPASRGLLFLLGWLFIPQGIPAQRLTDLTTKVTWSSTSGTPLQQLLQLGSHYGFPIGIVFGEKADQAPLCKNEPAKTFPQVGFSKIINALLAESGYTWHIDDGVIEIVPDQPPPMLTERVLQAKLDTFSAINSTIQGLGIVLQGYVTTILHPGEGYAGDIVASLDAETIPAFTLHGVSVRQAADSIVSRGSKGVWMIYETGSSDQKQVNVRALSYKDDIAVLSDTPCLLAAFK